MRMFLLSLWAPYYQEGTRQLGKQMGVWCSLLLAKLGNLGKIDRLSKSFKIFCNEGDDECFQTAKSKSLY